jgi:hypothetical protein
MKILTLRYELKDIQKQPERRKEEVRYHSFIGAVAAFF